MGAGDGFGGVEGGRAWRDAVCCERFVRGVRDCFWREGMRQRFEGGVVVEREVHALVGVDEDDDARRARHSLLAMALIVVAVARASANLRSDARGGASRRAL